MSSHAPPDGTQLQVDRIVAPPPTGDGEAKPDAIVFVPGLSEGSSDQSVDAVARRIASALDWNAQTETAKFAVREGVEEDHGPYKARMVPIVRLEDGKDEGEVVFEVYEMDYRGTLTEAFEKRSYAYRAMMVLLLAITNAWKLGWAWAARRQSKSFRQKLQILFGGMILLLLAGYVVLLLSTAVATAAKIGETAGDQPTAGQQTPPQPSGESRTAERSGPSFTGGGKVSWAALEWRWDAGLEGVRQGLRSGWEAVEEFYDRRLAFLQMLIVFLTAGGLLSRKLDVRDYVSRTGILYACVINYLHSSARKGVLLGQLASLMEHISEKRDERNRAQPKYGKVHVIGNSFGSVVVLDGLFQTVHTGARYGNVATLVTIGCPYDLIRLYWPGYFGNRRAANGGSWRWLNVYSPLDVLASNFRDDPDPKEAERGIPLGEGADSKRPENLVFNHGAEVRDLSLLQIVQMTGFRVHSCYWEESHGADVNCFHPIVQAIWSGTRVMQ